MVKNAFFFPSETKPLRQACAVPGCSCEGRFRAPKSKNRLHDYIWLCLQHVRAYNARWDYLAGLSEGEIEAFIRDSAVWERPTFKIGVTPQAEALLREKVKQSFRDGAWNTKRETPHKPSLPEDEALAVLGLVRPITFSHIKARYRSLAKRHHPDANGGSTEAVEKIKAINIAFATLAALYDPHKKNDQDRR